MHRKWINWGSFNMSFGYLTIFVLVPKDYIREDKSRPINRKIYIGIN